MILFDYNGEKIIFNNKNIFHNMQGIYYIYLNI